MDGESSASTALLCIHDDPQLDPRQWSVVLRPNKDKVVLYSASRNKLSVQTNWTHEVNRVEETSQGVIDEEGLEVITSEEMPASSSVQPTVCPLCLQPLSRRHTQSTEKTRPRTQKDVRYFALLSHANSRDSSPLNTSKVAESFDKIGEDIGPKLKSSTLNTGYFSAFFEEMRILGKGGNGTVYLVRHVLNGERLGLYACKKVPVGNSSPSLLRILREVHLLEVIQHQHIINYHHAWVEKSSFSSFGPPTPTLHILMAYANGGSLDAFILQRRGIFQSEDVSSQSSRQERLRFFRRRKFGAVHLLRLDEIVGLFEDICSGLAFLHRRNILHLDLKAENVLLHWDEDSLL
jgi:hypothetical protein